MKKINLISCLTFLYCFSLFSQMVPGGQVLENEIPGNHLNEIAFSNQNNLLPLLNFSSEIIVGVADMNGDKLDDIIRLENARFLTIEYQSNGQPYSHYVYGDISDDPQWSLAIADVDGNGYNDILLCGDNDGVKLLSANDQGSDYDLTILPDSYFFAQGSNFSDIDNDSDADVFVCNDLGDNRIWENNGSGGFSTANDWIDMSTVPPSDNSGNYASIWTDFDNDGDLDLYISKCKDTAQFPTDPRRINQLFVNDNGTFTEQAEVYGLKIGAQSWTSDFQDIDNDGDLDCLVINHLEASQLLENDGNGFFTDITGESGLQIIINHLQGQMRDFDNDGFVDILVAGNEGYEYYENNGDKTFTKLPEVFGNYQMGTFAIGDLNHDGFQDVYSGSVTSDDVLWINSRNENHFFSVNLTGTTSHINGLGSRVSLYGPWGVQIREVRAGESYGIHNSFTQHFGLGVETEIDSLVIDWPSGLREVFTAPQADQFLHIVENECAYPDRFITSGDISVFCSGDSLLLKAPVGETYLWSNGGQSQFLQINEGGSYQVTVTNAYDCSTVSDPIEIVQDPDETPQIVVIGNATLCEGQTVTLFSTQADAYLWSTNDTSQSIVVSEPGTYHVSTQGLCESFDSEPVEIDVIPLPEEPQGQNDTITEVPASAVLTAVGENLHWYDVPFNGNLLGMGNIFVTPEISETTSFYVEAVNVEGSDSCSSTRIEVKAVVDIENSITDRDLHNAFAVFPNPSDSRLIVENRTGTAAKIVLRLTDPQGRVVIRTTENLPAGEQYEMDLSEIIPGVYLLHIFADDAHYVKKIVVQK